MEFGKDYFGFIYIWYDTKRKMFYIGSHMGSIDDGYICSSKGMRDNNYRYRPDTFRRRILYYHPNNLRKELLEIENKWLNLIPREELGKRYYNLTKNTWPFEFSAETRKLQKDVWDLIPGKREGQSKRMKKAWTPERRKSQSEKLKAKWANDEFSEKMSKRKPRPAFTEEQKESHSKILTGRTISNTELMSSSAKIRANKPEHKENFVNLMSKVDRTNAMYITNGSQTKKIPKDGLIPSGWKLGRHFNPFLLTY